MQDLIELFIHDVMPYAAVSPVANAPTGNVPAVSTDHMAYDDRGVAIHACQTSLASMGFKAGVVAEASKSKHKPERTQPTIARCSTALIT